MFIVEHTIMGKDCRIVTRINTLDILFVCNFCLLTTIRLCAARNLHSEIINLNGNKNRHDDEEFDNTLQWITVCTCIILC